MGKQINVYERPLRRDEWEYLKQVSQPYLIAENEKVFGPVGTVEGHEWEELPEAENSAPADVNPDGGTPEPQGEEWDPDDVEFVDSLDYGQKQAWLKEKGLSAQGDKPTLRQRMLEHLATESSDEDEDEDEEIEDDE